MTIRTLPILLATLSLTAAGAASAQPAYSEDNDVVVTAPYAPPGAEIRSTTVAFEDLDLSTHAGAYTLLNRIKGAARQVCSPEATFPGDLDDNADYQSCMRGAITRAVQDVDEPALQDVFYQTRYGSYSYGG